MAEHLDARICIADEKFVSLQNKFATGFKKKSWIQRILKVQSQESQIEKFGPGTLAGCMPKADGASVEVADGTFFVCTPTCENRKSGKSL